MTEGYMKKRRGRVRCVETGEVFPSVSIAARKIRRHRVTLNECLRGEQKTCGGYHWEEV